MASQDGPNRTTRGTDFYASLPAVDAFDQAVDAPGFCALPADWVVGWADVVASTAAVADGRYKAVNLAGAAAISALANAFGTLDFPFVFTGDGMACVAPPEDAQVLARTLATTVNWIASSLDLDLRAAVVPLVTIRAAGLDVRVARFASSPHVSYAMFSGGGLAWVDAELKAERLPLLEAENGRPDLNGLSCRFKPIPSRRGLILSVVVAPVQDLWDARFQALLVDLIRMTAELNPVPAQGPVWRWPPGGLDYEARLHRKLGSSMLVSRFSVALRTLVAACVVRLGIRVGGFQPARYRGQIAGNSDFRKFGDSLMLTVDCSRDDADRVEARLAVAAADGVADYGTHRQEAALMTCLVPAPDENNHIHFIDGAGGGYTVAAGLLKRVRAERLQAVKGE